MTARARRVRRAVRTAFALFALTTSYVVVEFTAQHGLLALVLVPVLVAIYVHLVRRESRRCSA